MAIHSSILAWRIPWTEEPAMVSKRWTQLSNFHRNMKFNKKRFPQILYLLEYFQLQVTGNLNNYKLVHKINFCKQIVPEWFQQFNQIIMLGYHSQNSLGFPFKLPVPALSITLFYRVFKPERERTLSVFVCFWKIVFANVLLEPFLVLTGQNCITWKAGKIK